MGRRKRRRDGRLAFRRCHKGQRNKRQNLWRSLVRQITSRGDNQYLYDQQKAFVAEYRKQNTQRLERKHLSLRTWCSRLVRRGIRFSKTEQMHKIVIGLAINVHFFGYKQLIHNSKTLPIFRCAPIVSGSMLPLLHPPHKLSVI